MKIQVTDKPTGREWQITLTEFENTKLFAVFMDAVCARMGVSKNLMQITIAIADDDEKVKLLDAIKKVGFRGEVASMLGMELWRLGPSKHEDDIKAMSCGDPILEQIIRESGPGQV